MPLDRDSRSLKMLDEYRRRGFLVLPVIWSRGDPVDAGMDYVGIYSGNGGYGRRLGNLWVRIKWLVFLTRLIWINRNKIDFIHSVDLDVGIVTVPMGRLLGLPVVYDAFDQMASFFSQGPISRWLAIVERHVIYASSLVIFPDKVRFEQYGIPETEKMIVISNIPEASQEPVETVYTKNIENNESDALPLHFVYVGTLEKTNRALEFIPDICDAFEHKINFSVAGVGILKEFFELEARNRSNLAFLGQLTYPEATVLMSSSDCLYGPYLLTTPAHKYASPNKMYEHLALGKPLFTNNNNPVGDLVLKEKSGFVFDGSYDDIMLLISKINRRECRERGKSALQSWKTTYCNLRVKQLDSYFSTLLGN